MLKVDQSIYNLYNFEHYIYCVKLDPNDDYIEYYGYIGVKKTLLVNNLFPSTYSQKSVRSFMIHSINGELVSLYGFIRLTPDCIYSALHKECFRESASTTALITYVQQKHYFQFFIAVKCMPLYSFGCSALLYDIQKGDKVHSCNKLRMLGIIV